MFSKWIPGSRYSPLPESPEDAAEACGLIKPEQSPVSRHLSTSTLRLSGPALLGIILAVALSSGLAGYFIGVIITINRTDAVQEQGIVPHVPIKHNVQTFNFNQSFATPPTQGMNEPVWDALIPNGLGYVKDNPISGADLAVISSFHQLHCLYTLRRAYFSSQTGGEDFDFGLDRSNHTIHCFEYLRQSIMCSADSTLEPAEKSPDGFLGWGFQRRCRNYDQLMDWAEEYRTFEMHGFLADPGHHH